jgi:putative transposase
MGRELRIEFEHAFYHVMSRGNTRSRIFKEDRDRIKFLDYLSEIHEKFKVIIHSYCLMGNHYHLLIETPQGNLSKVMHTLNTSYTNYYNYWNKRTGHLFSGRYKSILVEKDSYAQVLSAYIHLNPVQAKLVENPYEYEWSSCKYYFNEIEQPDFMNTEMILGYFGKNRKMAQKKYIEYVNEQFEKKNDPFKEIKANTFLGSDEYLKWLMDNAEERGWIKRPVTSISKLYNTERIEQIIRDEVSKLQELSNKQKRKILIYLLRNKTTMSLKELGEEFGAKQSAIHMAVKRFENELEKNNELKEKIEKIKRKVKNV